MSCHGDDWYAETAVLGTSNTLHGMFAKALLPNVGGVVAQTMIWLLFKLGQFLNASAPMLDLYSHKKRTL